MRFDKFAFTTAEAAALFAATHDAVGVHVETLAHRFPVFFVTVRPRTPMTKFHDRVAAADYHC
jgi:hypothetical protein